MNDELRQAFWQAYGDVVAAHTIGLQDRDVMDEAILTSILTALDSVVQGTAPSGSLLGVATAFDDRLDSLTRGSAAGTHMLGRAGADSVATATRLVARDRALQTQEAALALAALLLELSAYHAVTLMPLFMGGQAAQPGTLGLMLGGVLAATGRGIDRLGNAVNGVNQSAIGAGVMAGTGMEIDREAVAARLGCTGVRTQTFDAVVSLDDFVALAEAAVWTVVPVGQLTRELLDWVRADPMALMVSDRGTVRDSGLPQAAIPAALHGLLATVAASANAADGVRTIAMNAGLEPMAMVADGLLHGLDRCLEGVRQALGEARTLLAETIEVNRAYLANRAGRGLGTIADLVDFLIIEEQVDPLSARRIAAIVSARAKEQGLEASGITPDTVDLAAMVVLGREIKPEIEGMSRYLAPRKFIERRSAVGAAAPVSTRAWLTQEQARHDERVALAQQVRGSIESAKAALHEQVAAAATEEQPGRY